MVLGPAASVNISACKVHIHKQDGIAQLQENMKHQLAHQFQIVRANETLVAVFQPHAPVFHFKYLNSLNKVNRLITCMDCEYA